ncbi:hypothetical protein Lesp02_09720 [Lentzea sp. NBRC 105346]|uniref:hypothetical protein n=1 Tax=Lentzea sp. NBRC 105346 TaxID=3032205 RepID=UPI0024A0450B|nr:hypothetical protein [Lentzea sp. NBRC 105346]GLZ28782.1 hypothetical protein Lesp02_09720 [Lentzea sp. NBRC 105346]
MLAEFTGLTALAELASRLTRVDSPVIDNWSDVATCFRSWAGRPSLRNELRDHLNTLSPREAMWVIAHSRETTTHFSWCLRDEPDEPFTFWLHEYKPWRDWRPGYADSVHNHRYHFCTTLLRGSYLHERYDVRLGLGGRSVVWAKMESRAQCAAGAVGTLFADDFHRIPRAADGTMTFLVKSRAVSAFSLSYDPESGISHRHVPVEERLEDLTKNL